MKLVKNRTKIRITLSEPVNECFKKRLLATSIDVDLCLLLTFGLVIAIVILSSSIMKVKFLICFQIHDS